MIFRGREWHFCPLRNGVRGQFCSVRVGVVRNKGVGRELVDGCLVGEGGFEAGWVVVEAASGVEGVEVVGVVESGAVVVGVERVV